MNDCRIYEVKKLLLGSEETRPSLAG